MAERGRGMGRRGVPAPLTKEQQEEANAEKEAYLAGKKLPSELLQEQAAAIAAAPSLPPAKLPYHLWVLQQTRNPKLTEEDWRKLYNSYVAEGGRRRKTRKSRRKHKKTHRRR